MTEPEAVLRAASSVLVVDWPSREGARWPGMAYVHGDIAADARGL